MAYDLHITKQEFWFNDVEENKISESEWHSLLEQHPELKKEDSIKENEMELKLRDTKIAKWITSADKNVWFKFSDGNIKVSNPDEETIQKMKGIASALDAKVQGDDGEIY